MSDEEGVRIRNEFVSLVGQLLRTAGEIYAERETLTPDICLKLYQIFGTPFRGCLDLLDEKAVKKLEAISSKRIVYQVRSDSGSSYYVLPFSNRCSCKAWIYRTWQNQDVITCKHVLASHLAAEIDRAISSENNGGDSNYLETQSLNEDAFIELIAGMD